jgi:hypothetical protein
LDELEVGNKSATSYPSKNAGQGPEKLKTIFVPFLLSPLQLIWTLTRTEETRQDNEERR